MKFIRKIGAVTLVAVALLLASAAPADRVPPKAGNVIFMVVDGVTPELWTAARWVKGAPLNVDPLLCGAVRTYGADSIITDSAPGATAYATGRKGTDKGISVTPWNVTVPGVEAKAADGYRPLASVLEGARLAGKATGVVATSQLQHATPAAFTAHTPDRSQEERIAEQQAYGMIDVLLGGGADRLGARRADGENLLEAFVNAGYAMPTDAAGLEATKRAPVCGLFAPMDLPYDVDRRREGSPQPSLAAMTRKAIELLDSSGKNGFYLFVEGSKVDWAAHANDPVAAVWDLLAFDDAVGEALRFAERDGDTLLVVTADHGTGGFSIGTRDDPNYSKTQLAPLVDTLRGAKASSVGFAALAKGTAAERDPAALKKAFADQCAVPDLSDDEAAAVIAALASGKSLADLAGPVVSKRARIGWTSNGHTGADVFLWAYGPGGKRPVGLWENTELARYAATAIGVDLDKATDRLFVEAGAAFKTLGASVSTDSSDPANPVLVVTKGSATARLPADKNLVLADATTIVLEGVVVYAEKTGAFWVPRQAVDRLKAVLK